MKKLLLIIASFCVMSLSSNAEEFFPGWQFGLRGGVAYTAGEGPFGNLLSPNASVTAGYQFLPWISLRGDVSGWQAKGFCPNISKDYKWNYVQVAADVVFDFCGMCKNYKFRVVNPYAFLGFGVVGAWNNGALDATILAALPNQYYPWKKNLWTGVGRIGAGVDFNVCRSVAITLELTNNILCDQSNSKRGDQEILGIADFDYHVSGLLGVKFMFGQAKKAKVAAANAAAAAAAAKEAAEKAAAEAAAAKAAADKAAAEKAAAEKAAAEKAAAEAAAAAKAAEEAAKAQFNQSVSALNPYFTIGSSALTKESNNKLNKVVEILNANPEYKVNVVGFADKETGTSALNMKLSKARAEKCANYIIGKGIAKERVITDWKGDTEVPFEGAKGSKSRTVIFFTK